MYRMIFGIFVINLLLFSFFPTPLHADEFQLGKETVVKIPFCFAQRSAEAVATAFRERGEDAGMQSFNNDILCWNRKIQVRFEKIIGRYRMIKTDKTLTLVQAALTSPLIMFVGNGLQASLPSGKVIFILTTNKVSEGERT